MTSGPHDPERSEHPQEQPSWPQYNQAPAGQPAYAYGYTPPVPMAPMHPQATTALVLGIIAIAGFATCGVTFLLGPFAWAVGAKAKREMASYPGHYRGESEANTGMILGIVSTVLLALAIVAVVLFFGLIAVGSSTSSDYSNA